MKVHTDGLTMTQWIICLVVSLICLLWNAILKCMPDKMCPTLGDESPEEIRESLDDYEALRGIASANKK